MTGTGIVSPVGLVPEFIHHPAEIAPVGLDIIEITPEIAVWREFGEIHIGTKRRPGAGVHDLASSFVQEASHSRISVISVQRIAVATIHLQIVNLPLGECASIV